MRVSNQWVLDASVALKWYLRDEEFLSQADRLLETFSSGEAAITAPSFIRYEVANALVVANRQGRLPSEQLPRRLQAFLALGIASSADNEEALLLGVELATQFPIAFYDALYLALAQQLDYNFVTADERLHERIKDKLPWVVWIGNLEAKV